MIKRILLVLLAIAVVASLLFREKNYSASAENISSEIVLDLETGRILYEKNAYEIRPIASLTKIMTAIICIENTDIKRKIEISEKCVGVEGSSIYLNKGEIFTIEDLLYGLMLRSGNDCAETLARCIEGGKEHFISLMNNKAKELGAKNTNFTNTHGLHDAEHYSTAYDTALISSYAMKNDCFSEIVKTTHKTIIDQKSGEKRTLINKNKLLYKNCDCVGIKTGYTKKAGRCLASSFVKDERCLISVVLGCAPMYEATLKNIENCFNEYNWIKLCSPENFDFSLDLENSDEKCYGYIKESFIYPLKKSDEEKIKRKIKLQKNLHLPIKKDEKIAILEIYLENQLIFSQNIYTILDVEKKFDFSAPLKDWNIVGLI